MNHNITTNSSICHSVTSCSFTVMHLNVLAVLITYTYINIAYVILYGYRLIYFHIINMLILIKINSEISV